MDEKCCAYCKEPIDEFWVKVNDEYFCPRCDAELTAEMEADIAERIAEFNQQRLNDIRDSLIRRQEH